MATKCEANILAFITDIIYGIPILNGQLLINVSKPDVRMLAIALGNACVIRARIRPAFRLREWKMIIS